MKNKIFILALTILIILGWSSPGLSLREKTHEAINQYVARKTINGFSLNDYLMNNLGLGKGVNEIIKGLGADGTNQSWAVFDWLGNGGVQEDRPGSLTDYVSFKPTRSVKHFHNPLKSPWDNAGLNDYIRIPTPSPPYFKDLNFTDQSSILWAQNQNQDPGGTWSWHEARKYYYTALTGRDTGGNVVAPKKENRDPYFAKTFRALGQLMHLVHDASVPEHVRNDIHILPAYEAMVEEFRTNRMKYPLLWDSFLASPVAFDKSILDIISTHPSASVPISRIIDTDLYNGNNPDLTRTNSSSGQPVGIAEYTNANFFSPDTMFTDGFDPEDRHYFPYPRRASAIRWKDDTNKRNYLGKAEEGDAVDHLAIESWFYFYRQRYFPQYTKYLPVGFDGKCYEEYASKLIPRAVGYSAGLLNYFFRGKLGVEETGVTPSGEVEITITNLSEEPLVDGVFELYYDNENGERIKLKLGTSEVKGLQKEAPFTTSFRRPPDIETGKEDEYMLVYKGQLGNEVKTEGSEGAVIGKYGFIGRVLPVMATYSQGEMKAFFKVGKREGDENNHDFFIDLDPVLRELGHSVISPVSLKIVEYSGTLGALVYTVNDTTYCVLMFEVLGLSSPEVEVNGYKKRDFVWACEQFDMSGGTIDPIPPIPTAAVGNPGMPMGTADVWFYDDQASRYVNCSGSMTAGGGLYIPGPSSGFTAAYWRETVTIGSVERCGVNWDEGPQTVAVPIGFSIWSTSLAGHLANIRWRIHFSCIAGYKVNYQTSVDYNAPYYYWNGQYFYWPTNYVMNDWIGVDAPFLLIKDRGTALAFQDPMLVFESVWYRDGYGINGPLTGRIGYGGPTSHSDASHHYYIATDRYWAFEMEDQWPGSYRRAYVLLNSTTGLPDGYLIHSRRPNYETDGILHSIRHLINGVAACDVAPDYDTRLRPPGYYYPSDTFTYKENTRPNGSFAWHAGGGTPNRFMLRIAPKSYRLSDYDADSGKDRSVYVIDGQIYDYDQPVPLLFGDSKVSRELLVAQSIYGMNKPAVVDSTIDFYGRGTFTGKLKGYLDLEGYDGYVYFSDFAVIKQSAAP